MQVSLDKEWKEKADDVTSPDASGTSHPDGCLGRMCCRSRTSCSAWCSKYFCEGQSLSTDSKPEDPQTPDRGPSSIDRFVAKHRKLVGFLIPTLFCHFLWWGLAIRYDLWHLFAEHYFICIMMVFGALIAGMTSEGAGAVAFPVLTLGFKIAPAVARDFSLMSQSAGMSAAAFTILFMKVQLENYALIFCSLGGVVGVIFGLHVIDPLLQPAHKKMGFVCIVFSFAFALFLLNRQHKRKTFKTIQNFNLTKAAILLVTGFVGGTFTAFSGSGLDICSFSVITLLFRVSEKTATPTSVMLMAGNTVACFYWRQVMMGGISELAWNFVSVSAPIVVVFAPLGSLIGSHFHRLVLATLVYVLDTLALVSAFIIVPQTPLLTGISFVLIAFGFSFFYLITRLGNRFVEQDTRDTSDLEPEVKVLMESKDADFELSKLDV